MERIGIIINPNAKRIRRSKKNLPELFRKIGGNFTTVKETRSMDDIPSALADLRNEGCSYIGICGGDGTIHQVLTSVITIWGEGKTPPVLILPCGTMNNVARTLNMRGKGPAVLRRSVKLLSKGISLQTDHRYTIKINGRYCFLFGLGFTSNFLDAVYSGAEKGNLQNIKIILSTIAGILTDPDGGPLFKPLVSDVKYDNQSIPFKNITGILAGTVEHIGMGFSPMPKAVGNETFQSIVSGMKPREFLRNLARLKKGRNISHPFHVDACVHKMSIRADEKFRYTMDGDMYSCDGSLEVSIGPAVTLVKI